MSTTITYEFDWTNTGVWVDESANLIYCVGDWGFREPVPSVNSPDSYLNHLVAPSAKVVLTLDNVTKRYSPDYSSGALFGNLVQRRPFRIRATDGVTTWTVFRGRIDFILPTSGKNGVCQTVIVCSDLISAFERTKVSVELLTGLRADQLVAIGVDLALAAPFASTSFTIASVPNTIDTYTLNGQVYTFALVPSVAYQVTNPNTGALPDYLTYFATNLAAAINADVGYGTVYGAGTFRLPGVFASSSGHVVTITSTIPGIVGNSYSHAKKGGAGTSAWTTLSAFSGGVDYPSSLTDYGASRETFDYAADLWLAASTHSVDVIRDAVNSDRGRFFVQRDGKTTFRDRRWFFSSTPQTPVLTLDDNSPVEVQSGRYIDDLYNQVKATVQPRALVGAPGVVAHANSPVKLPAASPSAPATKKVRLVFRDTANNPTGASNLVLPLVVGTDFNVGTQPEKNDYNASPSWSQGVPEVKGSEVIIPFTTKALGSLYVSDLQIRGNPVTNFAPITVLEEDATSESNNDKIDLTLPLPLSSDESLADSLALYYLNRYKAAYTNIRKITIKDHALVGSVNVFSINLFDQIAVTDAQLGLSSARAWVEGIHFFATPLKFELSFITQRADENTYWNLGVTNYSELGTNTRLAA